MSTIDEITVDDIQIGATADIRWRKGNLSSIYPAVLQKSRVNKGIIEYRVHYKNWNKRYDEWVELNRIMRIFDDCGNLLKSRVVEEDTKTEFIEEDDEADDEVLKPKRKSLKNFVKKNEDETTAITNFDQKPVIDIENVSSEKDKNMEPEEASGKSSLEEIGVASDSEEDKDIKEPIACAANCGEGAQEGSIYCSVDCIMKHAMSKTRKDKSPSTDVPSLEDVPVEVSIETDSQTDEDFVPELEEKKVKKSSEKKKRTSIKRKQKAPPQPIPKSPKPNPHTKRLSDKDINEIMTRVANMADDEPVMVMRYGALLTGFAAPRKSNLRKFLEENPVGTTVIWNESEPKKAERPKKFDKSVTISSAYNKNRDLLRKQKNQQLKQRPVATVAPLIGNKSEPFPGTSTLNPYARKETIKKSTEKERVRTEAKRDKKDRKGDDDGLSGKDVMDLIKRAQREGRLTGKTTPTAAAVDKKSIKKRLSSGDADKLETPIKKIRRQSNDSRHEPERAADPRHQVRKMLREALASRSHKSDLKMDLQSITRLVSKIEKNLFNKFKEPNKEYKAKFRQINFNLTDPKNDFFWRKVIMGEISTSMLHGMNGQEMASKEKIEWRKKLEKDDLDEIKKLEEQRQKEALKPTAKITHKGEIEIEIFDEPFEKAHDNCEIAPKTEDFVKDNSFTEKAEKKAKKKKKEYISKAELDTINRMITQKNAVSKIKRVVPEEPEPSEQTVPEIDNDMDTSNGLESPKTPDYYPDEPSDSFQDSPVHESPPQDVTPPAAMTPPLPPMEDSEMSPKNSTVSSTTINKVWSGKLNFPEASSFSANGYIISGNLDAETIKQSLSSRMHVVGRLDFASAEKYITEVRQTSDMKRISIMSLYGKTASEQTGYCDSLYYLTSKNKVGVVNNFSGVLKDVYLVPLHENQKLPDFMEPIDGIGLADEHPAIILALLVRKSDKKKAKVKTAEKPKKKNQNEEPELPPPPVLEPQYEHSDDIGSKIVPNVPISNDLFNTIKETLNHPNLKPLVPKNPVLSGPDSTYYTETGYSTAILHSNAPSHHYDQGSRDYQDYRPDDYARDRDNRDRDRRTYRPEYRPDHSEYNRTSHWDSRGQSRRNSRGESYRGDHGNNYHRDDRRRY